MTIRRFIRKLMLRSREETLRAELAEELAAHEALKYEEHLRAGLPPDDAERQARLDMGNLTLAVEQTADVRTFMWEQSMKDIWHGFTLLKKNPGFSLIAILSLALGIGGCTAVFSILNALLIRPLPFGEPDRLVRITEFFPKALLVDLRERSGTMDIASVSPGVEMNVVGDGPAYRVTASPVSANLLSVLRVPVHLGRGFEVDEDQPGRDRVAILSHAFWTQTFHADAHVIGRSIAVDGVQRTIIGIMPAGFAFPSSRVQLWVPATLDARQQVDYWAGEFTPLIGRLRAGYTLEQARMEVKGLVAGVWQMFPWPMPRHWNANATVIPLQQDLAGDTPSRLWLLLCSVGVVLVIACANVAGLLTVRGAARSKELAIRAALGAGRARIVRQLLTESIVLAGAAGTVGIVLAASAVQLFSTVLPPDLPGASEVAIDWNVAAFAAVLSLAAGVAFGIAPALSAGRLNLMAVVKSGGQRGATTSSLRFRSWLIAGQIALTLILTIAATLLVRSLHALSSVDPGFQSDNVVAVKISPHASFCETRAACIAFYQRTLDNGRAVEGVTEAALANTLPLEDSAPSLPMDLEAHPKSADFPAPMFWTGAITPEYFRVMGIPLIAGRTFTPADGSDSEPVVLLTASTARRFWPGESALGKHIKWASETRWRTVVGIVADVRQFNLVNRTPASISGAAYMPYAQAIGADGRIPFVMNLIAKTGRGASDAAEQLRQLALTTNPNIPVSPVIPLRSRLRDSISGFRSTALLFLGFAGVALVLAAMGVYGLVAWSVRQRAYEIALRMAIGATSGSVVRMTLGQSLRVGVAGIVAGVCVALLLTRGLSFMLYEVAPADPVIYTQVSAFLLAVVLLASIVPAWSSSRIDPVRVLRSE